MTSQQRSSVTTYPITRLQIKDLYGRLNYDLRFQTDLNILFGRNGSGKTTILHIIANLYNRSFDRFAYLPFSEITASFFKGGRLRVRRSSFDDDATLSVFHNRRLLHSFSANAIIRAGLVPAPDLRLLQIDRYQAIEDLRFETASVDFGQAAYFPAFRTMIEAWASLDSQDPDSRRGTISAYGPPPFPRLPQTADPSVRLDTREGRLTSFARTLFGPFVPLLNFPSPADIEGELASRLNSAALRVATESQSISSQAFVDAFATLLSDADEFGLSPSSILEEIKSLLTELDEMQIAHGFDEAKPDVYGQLRSILSSVTTAQLTDTFTNALAVLRDSLKRRIEI